MAGTYYPPVGLYFTVAFELFAVPPDDFRFQEVSGLNPERQWEAAPNKVDDIVLKRGTLIGSGIIGWCLDAFENFTFTPTNLTITLLDENHLPLRNWYIAGAIPKKLQISDLNVGENAIVVETLTLSYQCCISLPGVKGDIPV